MKYPYRHVLRLTICCLLLGTVKTSYALNLDKQRLQLIARGEIPWQSLSPEEQSELIEYRKGWDKYDSDKQNRIREGAQRYLSLPPERREKIKQQRKRYRELSPEEQKQLREEYRRNRR